jgi:hypothetical protein
MAARRSSRSRSGGGRRSSRAAQTNNQLPLIIGGGVVIVVILVAVAMNMGGDPPPNQEPVKEASKDPAPEVKPVKAKSENYSAKMLKEPDTPAPTIPASVLTKVDTLLATAKKLDIDARKAQNSGDSGKFNELINDSWDKLEELNSFIEKYTMWLEEADMGDWKVPSAYRPLQDRITKLDRIRGRVKRIKPNRR